MGAVGRFARDPGWGERAKPERLAALTRLRVLLIGWVLLYHLELALAALHGVPVAEAAVMKGYLGVDGFFVLSGFALYLGYRHRPPLGLAGWGEFVRRRAERIFPLHLAALGLMVLLVGGASLVGVRINDPDRFGATELLLQALLVNAWETTRAHAWNYPSWALSTIWAGYILFPVVLTAMLGAGRAACWGIVAASLGGLAWLGALPDGAQLNRTLEYGLLRFGMEFTIGIALARLVTAREVPSAGAGLSAAVLVPLGISLDLDVVAVAGLAGLVAWLGMRPAEPGQPRDLLWRLGEASFGVYLCWVFVEMALILVLRIAEPGQLARLGLMFAGLFASLAIGSLAWRLVEVPAARWLAPRAAAVRP
ncbi:acyltransferase family protein [Falsiroseomonas oryziterrae]|uniref:acyltransferase family protein n=1 Tax=Falsiroseomonas oryziterrae TaxID=2911368 RepID=UPI001F34D36C|nr:acyltransferase [Roseomonas sp. NPKOSM-4]